MNNARVGAQIYRANAALGMVLRGRRDAVQLSWSAKNGTDLEDQQSKDWRSRSLAQMRRSGWSCADGGTRFAPNKPFFGRTAEDGCATRV